MQCRLPGNGGHQPGQPDEDEGHHGHKENEDYDDNGRGGHVDDKVCSVNSLEMEDINQVNWITMDLMRMRKIILMTMV